MENMWRYAVAGSIKKTRIDENGVLRYGTSAFKGNTKVYLSGRLWDERLPQANKKEITVLGLCRGRRYYVDSVPIILKKGCRIPYPEKIFEKYEQTEYGYIANISTEKIIDVLKDFICLQEELVFFFLELPAKLDDETEIENGIATNLHKDIYYMDCLKKEEAFSFLDCVGELLANDGLCKFGFGSQSNNDEIMVGKYNVITICCEKNNSYMKLFRKNNIEQTTSLVTAWDTFSKDSPGVSEKIEINGKDVYSIIDDYKSWGIYFAERRIDK